MLGVPCAAFMGRVCLAHTAKAMSRMLAHKREDWRYRKIRRLVEDKRTDQCLERYTPWTSKAELWGIDLDITSDLHSFPSKHEDPELKGWCRRVERASGCALLNFHPEGSSRRKTFWLHIMGPEEAVKKALSYVDQGAKFVGGGTTETTEDCLKRLACGAAPVDKPSLEAMRGGGDIQQRTTQICINQKTFKRILRANEFGVLAAMTGVTSVSAELSKEKQSPWVVRGFEEGIHRAMQVAKVLERSRDLLPSTLAPRIFHFEFVMPPRPACTDGASLVPSTPVKGDGGCSSPSGSKRPRSDVCSGEQAPIKMVKNAAVVESQEDAVEDI